MKKIIKEQMKRFTPEILVTVISSMVGLWMAWHIYTEYLMTTLSDQTAHLVFARLLTDSLTLSIAQLGTWPPLLHILMMPATSIRPLFETGLAGAVTLLPIFVAGAILLYRLAYELTKDKLLSFASALIYVFNPYVLYYAVTPMMEVLFISTVIAVAYFLVLWLEYNRLRYLLLAGIFVTLASLSRYEGLLLIPVAVAIVITRLISRRAKYYEIEATVIIFGTLAVFGLVYLMVYNWIFAGHPFAFAGIGAGSGKEWFIGSRDPVLSLTRSNLTKSLQYIIHASYYVLGKPMVFLSLMSAVFVLFLSRERLKTFSAIFLLFVPFIAVLFALYRGSNSIHVPELFPFERFHNERYAILWVGFVALTPILLASYFKQVRLGIVSLLFIVVTLFFSGSYFYGVVKVEDFSVLKNNISASKREEPSDFIKTLRANYDFGKVLAVRFNNDFVYIDSQLPLKNYIYEGNYKYFDQALSGPWLYARWVIMQKPEGVFSGSFRDPIKDRWANDIEFQRYYSVITEEEDRRIYKLNDTAVVQYANEHGLNPDKIPSLNSSITKYNPDTIWQEMKRNKAGGTSNYNDN